MEIIAFIRGFITNIYKFAMHILDFFDEPSPPQMKLEYSRSSRNNEVSDTVDLDSILDEIINNPSFTENTNENSCKYTPLYFDNLSYSDFANTGAAAHQPNFFGGSNNYLNDLFFATTNDETLDINRPFFDENIERCHIDDDYVLENAAEETDSDMPDLVSISSSDDNNITPLVITPDPADDFVCNDDPLYNQ